MTETFSLLVYVLVLYWSLLYLRDRRLWQLAVVQALSVLLIGFQDELSPGRSGLHNSAAINCVCTGALPSSSQSIGRAHRKAVVLTTGLTHVIASLAIMFLMHGAYKQVNGKLRKREPLICMMPELTLSRFGLRHLSQSDATDPRFRELIANGR